MHLQCKCLHNRKQGRTRKGGRSTDGNAKKVIYDLLGRRVERVTRTGIYIVNGKKMVIRK